MLFGQKLFRFNNLVFFAALDYFNRYSYDGIVTFYCSDGGTHGRSEANR